MESSYTTDYSDISRVLGATTACQVFRLSNQFFTRPNAKKELNAIYHKLCLLFHPDKSTDTRAKEAFQIINNAHDTLLKKIETWQTIPSVTQTTYNNCHFSNVNFGTNPTNFTGGNTSPSFGNNFADYSNFGTNPTNFSGYSNFSGGNTSPNFGNNFTGGNTNYPNFTCGNASPNFGTNPTNFAGGNTSPNFGNNFADYPNFGTSNNFTGKNTSPNFGTNPTNSNNTGYTPSSNFTPENSNTTSTKPTSSTTIKKDYSKIRDEYYTKRNLVEQEQTALLQEIELLTTRSEPIPIEMSTKLDKLNTLFTSLSDSIDYCTEKISKPKICSSFTKGVVCNNKINGSEKYCSYHLRLQKKRDSCIRAQYCSFIRPCGERCRNRTHDKLCYWHK